MPGAEPSWKDIEPVIQGLAMRFDCTDEPHHLPVRQTSRDMLMEPALCKAKHSATVVDTQAVAEVLAENMTSGPIIGDNRLSAIGKHFDVWASNGS